MQPYTPELARTSLKEQKAEIEAGRYRFIADIRKGVVIERSGDDLREYPIVHAMGGKNVFYFLTQLERGRLQVLPVAYDVRRQEWFDTTASAVRHFGDRRDEALYWKERPLTFNTSCFSCHVSQLSKNYDLESDSYQTTWAEPGINCETCHGPSAEHVELFRKLPTNQPAPADLKIVSTKTLSVEQRNDLCAPCHAKMSPLTPTFAPGDRYFDCFDLVTFEDADFYPDGRDLGENYTYTLWRLSPCAKSGRLDCLHCHTSSGRYRFKEAARANDACLPCHAERVKDAPAHTHHKDGSPGNQCVACHMPMTEFARMRRSDHSMRPPTPATTLVYQSPNACNLCHTNQNAAWADKMVREWHERDYQKPVLERAAMIAAARRGDWTKLPEMLAYLSGPEREEIQSVSLVRLLRNCPSELKWPVLRRLMEDRSPLVRSAAAEALGDRLDRTNVAVLINATGDDFRLVRVRSAAALAGIPDESLPKQQRQQVRRAIAELIDSLKSRPDDWASHYNLGNILMARGRLTEAVAEFQIATRLQPDALPPLVNAALAYNALGQNAKAEASLRAALKLDPTNAAVNLNLGMLLGEMGDMAGAEKAFRTAFTADPRCAQAAYNLGVLLWGKKPEEALTWCGRAAELQPTQPKYGYTLAFFQWQQGKTNLATETLEKLLRQTPAHADSVALLGRIYEEQKRIEEATALYRRAVTNQDLTEMERLQFRARLGAVSGN